jgi:hypothetical protein
MQSTSQLLKTNSHKQRLPEQRRLAALKKRSASHQQLSSGKDLMAPKVVTYGQGGRDSLLNFLSGALKGREDFHASTLGKPKSSLKVVKLYLTMEEAMAQGANRETDLIVEPETKLKEEDPLRILLYDTNIHNRKRAARIIAKQIESEVKGKRTVVDDESSVELDSSFDEPEESKSIIPSMSLKEFKERLEGCSSLKEKLDRIDILSSGYYTSLRRSATNRGQVNEEGTKDAVRTTFDESSSQLKQNKSTERMRRMESRASIDPSELFYHSIRQRPVKFNTRLSPFEMVSALSVKGIKELIARLVESDMQQLFLEVVSKTQFYKQRNDKAVVVLSFVSMSLPDCSVNKLEGLYLATRFAHFAVLREVNLAGNSKIGDVIGHCLVKVLAKYADQLELLNLSHTRAGLKTCEALAELLQRPGTRLKSLNMERNQIDDSGLEKIVDHLSSSSLEILVLSSNPISQTGCMHLSKLVRLNKHIKCLKLSGLPLSGPPMHDISRSFIVNTTLKSCCFNRAGLTDADMREICFSLTVNQSLNLISLTDNSFSKEALKLLAQLMVRNTSLLHIGLSGNTEIKIEHLDSFKETLPETRDLEILKQEDLATLQGLMAKGLTRYL